MDNKVVLHGATLGGASLVQFRYAGGAVCSTSAITQVPGFAGQRIQVTIPPTCPLGLAQVRVRRTFSPSGCTNSINRWSRQCFGYFVIERGGP